MDFGDLQVFKAVVEEGGITRAAKRLHRVQSNVTTRIQQLEASLGAKLFLRQKQRLHLSPAGKLFLGYVDQILNISEQARGAVTEDAPKGVLRIGTLESTAASRLPLLLSRYHTKFPAVRVELVTGTADAMRDALLNREVEAAFIADCVPGSKVETMPAFEEELVLIAPRSRKEVRHPRDVRDETLITFPKGCAYRRRLQDWLATGGVIPEKTLELSSYHAIVACVAAGTGIALAPRSVLEVVRGAESVQICPLPERSRRAITSLAWRKGEVSWALKALQAEIARPTATAPAAKRNGSAAKVQRTPSGATLFS
ncbi:MAG: LysR family transcriptional regulator [Burkholderiales bacterium]